MRTNMHTPWHFHLHIYPHANAYAPTCTHTFTHTSDWALIRTVVRRLWRTRGFRSLWTMSVRRSGRSRKSRCRANHTGKLDPVSCTKIGSSWRQKAVSNEVIGLPWTISFAARHRVEFSGTADIIHVRGWFVTRVMRWYSKGDARRCSDVCTHVYTQMQPFEGWTERKEWKELAVLCTERERKNEWWERGRERESNLSLGIYIHLLYVYM